MATHSKNSKSAVTTGVLAALAASSCCISPVISAVAGIGGMGSTLSWMEPLRPYLIGLAVLAIGYAWYAHLKRKKTDHCRCDIRKPKFYQTKGFLIGITAFAIITITFPYYSGVFFSTNRALVLVNDSNRQVITVEIEGMTCEACQNHINHAVNELNGIVNVASSYTSSNATIEFDNTQTSTQQIETAINTTGYTVKHK